MLRCDDNCEYLEFEMNTFYCNKYKMKLVSWGAFIKRSEFCLVDLLKKKKKNENEEVQTSR
jgi:hypothetical protein